MERRACTHVHASYFNRPATLRQMGFPCNPSSLPVVNSPPLPSPHFLFLLFFFLLSFLHANTNGRPVSAASSRSLLKYAAPFPRRGETRITVNEPGWFVNPATFNVSSARRDEKTPPTQIINPSSFVRLNPSLPIRLNYFNKTRRSKCRGSVERENLRFSLDNSFV